MGDGDRPFFTGFSVRRLVVFCGKKKTERYERSMFADGGGLHFAEEGSVAWRDENSVAGRTISGPSGFRPTRTGRRQTFEFFHGVANTRVLSSRANSRALGTPNLIRLLSCSRRVHQRRCSSSTDSCAPFHGCECRQRGCAGSHCRCVPVSRM